MSNVVIVPGLHDSGPQHWQTLWQQQLPGAVRVEQQQWDVPDLLRWSGNVAAVLNDVDEEEGCWIVAHSFGCLATVYALAKAPGHSSNSVSSPISNSVANKVRGLFLVAPADPHKFAVADLLPTRSLHLPGCLIASRSDPWLSWTGAQQWARRWQLTLLDAGDAGHINAESGHGAWPQGWRELQQWRGYEQPLRRVAEPRWALAI